MRFNSEVFGGNWSEVPYITWSKFFLCRSDKTGNNPVVVAELPKEQFSWENNNLFTGPIAFDVSWTQQKAVTIINRWHDNVQFIDLQTGKFESHTIGDPSARGFSGFRGQTLEIINNGSQILWSMYGTIAGVMDFSGNGQLTNVWNHEQRELFQCPVWDEAQGMIILPIALRILRNPELWLFNTKFELVEKIDAQPLLELWNKNFWKHRKTEHKYAWVLEKGQQKRESKPIEFPLKNHTIKHTRIDPKDAAGIW